MQLCHTCRQWKGCDYLDPAIPANMRGFNPCHGVGPISSRVACYASTLLVRPQPSSNTEDHSAHTNTHRDFTRWCLNPVSPVSVCRAVSWMADLSRISLGGLLICWLNYTYCARNNATEHVSKRQAATQP
jgi:hypothetical protein